LPSALALRRSGRALTAGDRDELGHGRGLGRGRLLGLLERHLRLLPADLAVDVLPARVLRLALLPDREQRGRDEDRRVGAGADPNEESEREVLERLTAEEEERRDGSVMNVVARERRMTSQSETFVIVANDARRISGMFSRMRSKMMMVS
jgi:hypothetical protein